MAKQFLNDEEAAVLEELRDYTAAQKIEILRDAEAENPDPGTKRLLRALLLKLSGAKPKNEGVT